ncbi:MAG: hypothetical protein NXI20_20475 [bacterium]|nr:hypothetical protein [bacterium]
MVDTLWLKIQPEQAAKILMSARKEHNNFYRIGNLTLRLTRYGWYLNGSITKFIVGNNMQSHTWLIVDRFLLKMKKKYGVDLRLNPVSRLDIGIVVSHPEIPNLISAMIELNRRYRVNKIKNNSITFSNKSSSLVLYNKTEQSSTGDIINCKKNLLRIEYRLLNGKSTNRQGVFQLEQLRQGPIQRSLEKKLMETIKEIKWYKTYHFQNVTSFKEIEGFLLKECLIKFGEDNLYKVLEDLKNSKLLTTSRKSELWKSIVRKCSEVNFQKLDRRKDLLKKIKIELIQLSG